MVAMSSAEAISASARQVVDDLCLESQRHDESKSLLVGSTACAASSEEMAEVKYEDLPRPAEVLMVAESSTSDSDSTSSDSSEEVEGVTASLANFNRPLVPSPPMPPEAAEIMYIHKRFGTQHRRHQVFATKLVCGRPLHQGFVQVSQDDGIERPLCGGCFNDKSR